MDAIQCPVNEGTMKKLIYLDDWHQSHGCQKNNPKAMGVTVVSQGHWFAFGPCGWDILRTKEGIFYRPDTYFRGSPYGWSWL